MVYRIRYSGGGQQSDSETVVEAGNTTEALVKFRHTCDGANGTDPREAVVISICPEPVGDAPPDGASLFF